MFVDFNFQPPVNVSGDILLVVWARGKVTGEVTGGDDKDPLARAGAQKRGAQGGGGGVSPVTSPVTFLPCVDTPVARVCCHTLMMSVTQPLLFGESELDSLSGNDDGTTVTSVELVTEAAAAHVRAV